MNEILEYLAVTVALICMAVGFAVFVFIVIKFIAEYRKYDSDRW